MYVAHDLALVPAGSGGMAHIPPAAVSTLGAGAASPWLTSLPGSMTLQVLLRSEDYKEASGSSFSGTFGAWVPFAL